MTDLADRCAAVVERYGGTVDKFTGDGIMAVFGAPVALEDHAVRARIAALAVQEIAKRLAAKVHDRDDVELRLRVGLNSGRQVIAGEIGSGPAYRQRAIIDAVVTITVHPSGRCGRVFRREDVDIVFHTAGVGAARTIK
jgi:class 3 adenylate cyclase